MTSPIFLGHVYRIENVNNGLVLDVAGSVYAHGTAVIQFRATGNDNQLWRLLQFPRLDGGTGFVNMVVPKASPIANDIPDLLMGVADDGYVQLQASHGQQASAAQRWLFQLAHG